MGLIDKMMGPRRDDPKVVEYLAAHADLDDPDRDGDDGSRIAAARASLPPVVVNQLDRELRW